MSEQEAKTAIETPAPQQTAAAVPPAPETAKEQPSLAQAEAASGLKSVGQNEEALLMAKKEGQPEPEKDVLPSFFVEESDRISVEVDILYNRTNGRIASISRKGLVDLSDFKVLGHTVEKFEFSMPSYEDMSNYRQRCSVFRKDAGRVMADPVQIRSYLLVWHLKDWSLRDRKGVKIELTHNPEGALEDDCLAKVMASSPVLLDVVLTLFEKDMMM